MAEHIIFFLVFPIIFSGMVVLAYWIRTKKRYDVMFNIDWDSMTEKDRVKLLNLVTSALMIFGAISVLYFPISYAASIHPVFVLSIYFSFVIVMTIVVVFAISRYSKWTI